MGRPVCCSAADGQSVHLVGQQAQAVVVANDDIIDGAPAEGVDRTIRVQVIAWPQQHVLRLNACLIAVEWMEVTLV